MRQTAKQGEVSEAVAKYIEALSVYPELHVDPETEAGRIWAVTLMQNGYLFAQEGNLEDTRGRSPEGTPARPNA